MLADEEVQATCTLTITLDNTDANDGYKIRGDNSYWGYKVFAAAETKWNWPWAKAASTQMQNRHESVWQFMKNLLC